MPSQKEMLRLVAICLHTVYDNQELVTDVLLERCQKLDDISLCGQQLKTTKYVKAHAP